MNLQVYTYAVLHFVIFEIVLKYTFHILSKELIYKVTVQLT